MCACPPREPRGAASTGSAPFTRIGHLRHNKACVAPTHCFSSQPPEYSFLWDFFFFVCVQFASPLDANPRVGKLRRLFLSASRAADELGFVCFVVHWAPFSSTDCLNTPSDTFAAIFNLNLIHVDRRKKKKVRNSNVIYLFVFFPELYFNPDLSVGC